MEGGLLTTFYESENFLMSILVSMVNDHIPPHDLIKHQSSSKGHSIEGYVQHWGGWVLKRTNI